MISPPVPGEDPSPLRRGRPGYDLASVLAVAVEVFNERGYDGTSMRDLADRLGIAKSAIYHHVAGKEELLRLALDRALAGLSAAADRARVLPAPAIERLEYLIRSSVDVLEADLPYVTLLLRVRGNTEVERAALDQRRALDRFVAELVAQSVRDGDIRPDVDAMITARLLFGLVNSLVEWDRPARRADTGSLADALCAIVFDGLRTRRGPSRPAGPAYPGPARDLVSGSWPGSQHIAKQRQPAAGLDPEPGRGGQFLQRADGSCGTAHPSSARMHRERPSARIEVCHQQPPAWPGYPVHLAERRLTLPRRDMMHGERAGDGIERRIGQAQILRRTHGERHGGKGAAPGALDRRRRRVYAGDPAGRASGGGQLAGEVPAAAPHVQDRIPGPHAGQRGNPPVHASAPAAERDLADDFVQPVPVDRGARTAAGSVQPPERVMHDASLVR